MSSMKKIGGGASLHITQTFNINFYKLSNEDLYLQGLLKGVNRAKNTPPPPPPNYILHITYQVEKKTKSGNLNNVM